jgi:hypothetical protein
MTTTPPAMAAQADLHHQLLLGLELMVATREGPQVVGEWMFRLFRQQHEDKFLSSFGKLGLHGLPHAVACARYHVLSNGIGGVAVEYMEESDTRAWVRFRYPRWMYDGAAICGVPLEASRGFLRGWYAHNGVSLGNPRLGFVCVSEDMSGQYGLCGYFREYTHALAEHERLVFAPHEHPPPFDPARQPQPPEAEWSAERLAKAKRNYALDYVRNGVAALVQVLGRERALALAGQAARLTGLQQYRRMAAAVGGVDGGPPEVAVFLAAMFEGLGDDCRVEPGANAQQARLQQHGLRVLRGLDNVARADLLACWAEVWRGAVHSHRAFMELTVAPEGDSLWWTISARA